MKVHMDLFLGIRFSAYMVLKIKSNEIIFLPGR